MFSVLETFIKYLFWLIICKRLFYIYYKLIKVKGLQIWEVICYQKRELINSFDTTYIGSKKR